SSNTDPAGRAEHGRNEAEEQILVDDSGRSICQRCEHLQHEHMQSLTEMKASYEEKLKKAKSDLKQKEEDLNALRSSKRCKTEVEVRSSCQQCEHKQRENLTEMEKFYKNKLDEARSALKQKEEELKSFKQRLATDMTVSLKTSNTESMNNPVSKTRLTEMYDNLKLLQWPKIKDQLKSRNTNPEVTKDLIQ
ncbi:hypothetical protein XENOCAPTIV_018552, partial [Xenoophorus captivus]